MTGVEVREVQAKSILSPASGYIEAYDFTLSPQAGCGHGCSFCYVPSLWYVPREIKNPWGKLVLVKANAVELLRRDGQRGKLKDATFYWSPNTDPLQPHEAKLLPHERQFHELLEVFLEFPPKLLVVQTRSPWVTDYRDLLKTMGQHVVVAMSITTNRDDVRRIFEPRCSSIRKRVESLAELHAAGIRTQASLAPLLPCDPEYLAELVAPHSDWVVAQALKMRGPGARTWAPALQILTDHGWEGWTQNGPDVLQALALLEKVLGPKYHEGREGFSFPASQVQKEEAIDEEK
jgi:DNA repair photolyase